MVDLKVDINKLVLKNPVMTASGTFGFGEEFRDFMDLNRLGGFVVKGTTFEPRQGNAYPRMAETPSGMLNAVGLQNKGVHYFAEHIYPRIKGFNTHIFVNVNGSTIDDYVKTAEVIASLDDVPGIELNISCPNVKHGGMAFGTNPDMAREVTEAVRKVYPKHLMVKLSPNVTDVTQIALAVQDGGADSLSVINTLVGMAVDIHKRKPVLSTVTGGLSGPCIKPVALRMVYQVYKKVNIPIIGIGGIMNAEDAIEFMLAGATAVQVGTANFIDPQVSVKVVEGIEEYLERYSFKSAKDIIGLLHQ